MNRDTSSVAGAGPAFPAPRAEPAAIEVGTLLGAAREVIILHKGERYRLRLTQNDKLILTK